MSATPVLEGVPLDEIRSAALGRAEALGCAHAEVRVERIRDQVVSLRDGRVETASDDVNLGVGLRVVLDGSVGFAATVDLGADAAARLADDAVELARAASGAMTRRVELAAEPAHGEVSWSSPFGTDPTDVPLAEKIALLEDWTGRVLGAEIVDHVTANVLAVSEEKYFADLAGTVSRQRRV